LPEHSIDFFVALVKEDVIAAASEADRTIAKFQKFLYASVVRCGDLSGK